ncbi:hypothetical protein K2173_005101 [Erythroxylum novogranatense]|uniref:mannosyl-glycoprotein endo-beta-N-acetylglucosaminidase n=1 Tax=Erythroxylum novogranatense TaxID=1862640 RepID=A0AAV8TCS0_9ROSI|nr:hypothetical protein K2173_005101 [Erythroxylum novogranatense]
MCLIRSYLNRRTLGSFYNLFKLVHNIIQFLFTFLTMTHSIDSDQQPREEESSPFDPTQPSVPVSYPIKTLEELESRVYFNSFHYPFNKASVPLQGPLSLPNKPRLLVCHDMKGGYLDDKWVQGGTNPDAYSIWHWYLIDIFVYFSHSLVSLPPPCWTYTAHRHGTKVLGTFITEWDEGRLICNELLKTRESAHMYAERWAELTVALGFDGWLINMEIKLSVDQIPNLKEFVSHLTQTMHSSLPGSLVIWYDSVTIYGDLKWQDQLNEKNKSFFNLCDGIFVNYTWKKHYPQLLAAEAGIREFDVYIGIDVYGRNTYGGGQWNTNIAFDVIKEDNVSAAIFALAWVYEIEQGFGYHISVEGRLVKNAPWNNLSCQGFQVNNKIFCNEVSYCGGAIIKFKGTLHDDACFITSLFQGEVVLDGPPLLITYSVKSEGDSFLGLSLEFTSAVNERTSVLIAARGHGRLCSKFHKVIEPHRVRKLENTRRWVIYEVAVLMDGQMLTDINAVCYRPKLEEGEKVSENEAENQKTLASSSEFFALLGNITIRMGIDCRFAMYNVYFEKLTKQKNGDLGGRLHCNLKYLGLAHVEAFYVSDLRVPSDTSSIRFIVQVCGIDEARQKLSDSPFLKVDLEEGVPDVSISSMR